MPASGQTNFQIFKLISCYCRVNKYCYSALSPSISPASLPSTLRCFAEVLKDAEHLELFHHFVATHAGVASEQQLLLWMAVEDLKSSLGNHKACSTKTRKICKRFFTKDSDKGILCAGK